MGLLEFGWSRIIPTWRSYLFHVCLSYFSSRLVASHRIKSMKVGMTLIEIINKICLLQHLSFMFVDSLKHVLIHGCPFIFKCEAIESLLEALYRRTQLVDSWRSLKDNRTKLAFSLRASKCQHVALFLRTFSSRDKNLLLGWGIASDNFYFHFPSFIEI